MRVGQISGDMAVKLALTAGAILAAWYAWQKVKGVGSSLADLGGTIADKVRQAGAGVADAVTSAATWADNAVTVSNPPMADQGDYSPAVMDQFYQREAAAAAGKPVSGWEQFKFDVTHLFNP